MGSDSGGRKETGYTFLRRHFDLLFIYMQLDIDLFLISSGQQENGSYICLERRGIYMLSFKAM